MRFQNLLHAAAGLGLPFLVAAQNVHRHRAAVLKITQRKGAVHQYIGRLRAGLPGKVAAFDQRGAVRIARAQRKHPVGAAQRELHFRVDLQPQRAVGRKVGLVVAEKYQAETGRQPGQRAARGGKAERDGAPGRLQQHGVLHAVAHPVTAVGRLDKAAAFIQQHRIGRVRFQHQIVHAVRLPPCGAIWHRCPRMISYPLVKASRMATRYLRWRSMVFLSTPLPSTSSPTGSRRV